MKDTPTARAARRQQWLEQIDGALRRYGMAAAGQLALQALADGVEHPAVLNLAASVRYGEGRIDEAASLLKRARSLAPKDAHILNSLGVCLKALGDTDGALRAYEAATRADPGVAAAHFNRGSILEERSDISGARLAYERATELDPNYVEPLAGLDIMRKRRGLSDERLLCSGPGRLCEALAVTSWHNGLRLDEPPFDLIPGEAGGVVTGPRIGISKAMDVPWRFGERGSRFLSRPFPKS